MAIREFGVFALFMVLLFCFVTPSPPVSFAETTSSAAAAGSGSEISPDLQHPRVAPVKETAIGGPGAPLEYLLGILDSESDESETRIARLFSRIPQVIPDIYQTHYQLCPAGTNHSSDALANMLHILLFLLIGLGIEWGAKRWITKRYFSSTDPPGTQLSQLQRFGASVISELPDMIGLCLFFGSSYISFILFENTRSEMAQMVFFALLLSITLIRCTSILSKLLFSPKICAFRILPISKEAASRAHTLLFSTLSYIILVLMFSIILRRLGTPLDTVLLLQLFFATVLLAITAAAVLIFRKSVENYILGAEAERQGGWGRREFASIWHLLAIIYLGLLWILLLNSITSPTAGSGGAFLLSFFVVPLWMVADQIAQWLVRYAMSTLKIHQEEYQDEGEVEEEIFKARERGRELYRKTRGFVRVALVFAFCVWIANLWNFKIPFLSQFANLLFNALIILTLALLFWQFVSGWIERKIEESLPEDDANQEADDEWGGAANRGRSYTLLPMVRKFIASVLVVMVTLTLLSSLGVDIGPLLAGAGVVGLAVGFGAQKLVTDVFSGFFYLLDDAFRVGEYLTAGSVSGTVETITLRNVMLRHHRGMLQIVPHSELGAITNYMRGGMVVKFNLDFPYDAPIDKIRKVIKKVGIAMLEDEELGKDFIKPVKSQGVREISNSVMTIRVKFTAKPGTHFVIRREAFKRITEALQKQGIHYAHRKVIVDVPGLSGETVQSLTPGQVKRITDAAGAAAGAVIQEEIQNQQGEGQTTKPSDTMS